MQPRWVETKTHYHLMSPGLPVGNELVVPGNFLGARQQYCKISILVLAGWDPCWNSAEKTVAGVSLGAELPSAPQVVCAGQTRSKIE